MSRALFMAKLKEGLAGLPQPEIDAVISDYEFHFAEAAATGQSEENIVARLGDPAGLARELRGGLEKQRPGAPFTAPRAGKGLSAGRLQLVLIFLVGSGLAAAYYLAGRNIAVPANSPVAKLQQPATVPGAKVMILGGQVLDLGVLKQDRIEIVIDGGGRATASGRVNELTVHVDGSGSADFGAVQADVVHVDLSGTGNAEISAAKMGDIVISGSGTVRLKTKPKTLKQSLTGSGRVILP